MKRKSKNGGPISRIGRPRGKASDEAFLAGLAREFAIGVNPIYLNRGSRKIACSQDEWERRRLNYVKAKRKAREAKTNGALEGTILRPHSLEGRTAKAVN
jgi:hypothetical protein